MNSHTADTLKFYIKNLINQGFGAIQSKESVTGHVDLFGNPCVTPKQIKEGLKLEDWYVRFL